MNKTYYDVIIIGGGPAGAVSGIYLSRAGLKTVIVERKNFPRETLCGEFLSHEVSESLLTLDLYEKFLELKPNRISSFRLVTRNKVINSNLSFKGFSLKRSILDNFLLKQAESSGAVILQPAEVREVIKRQNDFSVQFNFAGVPHNLSAAFVLGAYGKRNILDRKLERKFSGINSLSSGLKFHISKKFIPGIEDSCIYIFSGNNIYCGINTVSREEATVCFLNNKRSPGESSLINFEQLFEENKNLAALFNFRIPDLKKLEVYGAGNIFFGKKELVRDGIIMVGDAAKVIAPLAGDGIAMAFQSAELASMLIKNHYSKKINFKEIERLYELKWNECFSRRVYTALFIQKMLLQHHFLNLIPGRVIKSLLPVIISATRN